MTNDDIMFATPNQIPDIYPGLFSVAAIRAMISKSYENGFYKCLRRVGRRIYINLDDFESWIDSHKVKTI